MPHEEKTFREVFNRWTWKPIRHCPGRYIFAEGVSRLTAGELTEGNFPVLELSTEIAADKVIVMKFDDGSGGIISYKKDDSFFLHTLNDAEGFARKLAQLRINA